MSVQIENLTERQLKFAVLKLAATLAFGLLLVAAIVSIAIGSDSPYSSIPINALLLAVAVMILAQGCLAILHIIDWFENRRARKAAK